MSRVIVVLGYPASGKTTISKQFAEQGYIRINRDELGGSVESLLPLFEKELKTNNVVIDNLFATTKSRAPFISVAKKFGATIECHWMQTSIEDAQYNYCLRSMIRHGEVLSSAKNDPNTFPPAVIFKYRKDFEAPTEMEGFDKIVKIPFVRKPSEYTNKALILDYDGTLRECVGGNGKYPVEKEQVKLLPGRTEKIQEFVDKGYILCGASNQSGVGKGDLTAEKAKELFEYTNKLLKHNIDFKFDTSRVPPITSWSRKPLTGMGVYFIEKYKLDPKKCIMVGDLKEDNTFADRCGFTFIHADNFF